MQTRSWSNLEELFGVMTEDGVEREVVQVAVLVATVVVVVDEVLDVVVRADVLDVLRADDSVVNIR